MDGTSGDVSGNRLVPSTMHMCSLMQRGGKQKRSVAHVQQIAAEWKLMFRSMVLEDTRSRGGPWA